MRKKFIIVLAGLFLCGFVASAQKVSIGTNLLQWVDLGTINAEMGVAVGQKISIHAGARYNNWSFGPRYTEKQFLNRKRTVWLGARWWPWYVNSGWFVQAKGQVQEYNRNIFSEYKEQGIMYGGGISGGYAFMLSKHLNLEVGLGVWCGSADYSTFTRAEQGDYVDSGRKFSVLPDDAMVSLVFIF